MKGLSLSRGVPLSTMARNFPFGDQESFAYHVLPKNHRAAESPTLRSGPPSALITKIPVPAEDRRRKAICRPSGDHVGLNSSVSSFVRRSGVPAGAGAR